MTYTVRRAAEHNIRYVAGTTAQAAATTLPDVIFRRFELSDTRSAESPRLQINSRQLRKCACGARRQYQAAEKVNTVSEFALKPFAGSVPATDVFK